jgi:hypothetical protein
VVGKAGTGKIVVGLGSGRSGTASLASLIDRQIGGLCFHEMNPSGAVFAGNPQAPINAISEFSRILSGGERNRLSIDYARISSVETYNKLQQMPEVRLLGDIAYYYLSYVEDILKEVPEAKFVCIKRDREQTVASWLKKSEIKRWRSLWLADRFKAFVTRTPFHTEYNHWQQHDGSVWKKDAVWDSCFPKFEASSKESAIRQYWDFYYEEASRLESKVPESFRIFSINDLSAADGQQRILSFAGLQSEEMICGEEVHLHKSA